MAVIAVEDTPTAVNESSPDDAANAAVVTVQNLIGRIEYAKQKQEHEKQKQQTGNLQQETANQQQAQDNQKRPTVEKKKRVQKISQRLGNGKRRLADVRQVNVACKVHNKRYEMVRACATVAACVLHVPSRMTEISFHRLFLWPAPCLWIWRNPQSVRLSLQEAARL